MNLHFMGRSTEKGKISGHGLSSATAAVILSAKDSSETANFLSRYLLLLLLLFNREL